MTRSLLRRWLIVLAVAALVTSGGVATSSAVFTATSATPQGAGTASDWVAPVLTIDSPAGGARTGGTPLFSGTAGILAGDSATATLRIYTGPDTTGTLTQTLSATRNAATGAWSVTAALLAEGTFTAQASQSDSGSNTGTSDPITFIVDRTAPAPVITAPAGGATVGPSPIVSGTAGNATGDAATVTVNVYAGATATGAPVRTLSATRSGTAWTVVVSPALTSGTFTLRATQADDVGNSANSLSVTISADATGPTSLAITSPVGGAYVGTGTPTLSGQAGSATGDSLTVTIKIYTGATATGVPARVLATTRSGSGWTVATTPVLAAGQYTAVVEQLDNFTNLGQSAPVTFTIDLTAPVVVISAPTANQPVLATPVISGTGGLLAGDLATMTLTVYAGSTATGTALQTQTASRNATTGAYTFTATTLAAGTYTAKVAQSDSAGNIGSATVTFIVDLTKPTATLVSAPNAAGAAGHLDAGDRVVFTFSEAMSATSILAGWTGPSTPVIFRIFNSTTTDKAVVLNPGATASVKLTSGGTTTGGLNTKGDFVSATVSFTGSTMVMSADMKTVTVTLGTPDIPANIKPTAVVAKNMIWTPSTSAKDLAGNVALSTAFTETDTDIDF